MAEELKERGNACFKNDDYVGAEKFYTQAILKDPTNPAFFTNRALVRCRLGKWTSVIHDSEEAIRLLPTSLKAFTYLGQAYLQLNNPVKSFEASQRAYTLAIEQRSRSISIIAATCLDAKKADWEQKEKVRIQRESTLLRETCSLLMHNAEQMAWDLPSGEAQKLRTEAGKKCRELEDVFGKSEAERLGRREVPEWLIDNITFGIMWDPVVTIHGHSYNRATLVDHLRCSKTDPLTREPLTEDDLRPNLALKHAADEFLKENGWAVDW